ncbi:MAG: hypothetical protein OXG15_12010 [Gammaproteobacteria bacterium]|nr:hypothetical protein [Gammaproteobacteria bacterium]
MNIACETQLAPVAQFSVSQRYDRYSDSDHESWHYAMRALVKVLRSRCAVPHAEAMRQCGLNSDRLPRMSEINHALDRFGWETMMVDSFIPPPTFMALQAQRVLPITRHVRAQSQLGYTPIPDIIHEAAGHLPMLVEPEYRRFLQRFGEEGQRLRYSGLDERVYVAQKRYAEYAGLPNTDVRTMGRLKDELELLRVQQKDALTPACLLSRFHWWTVEYGMVGRDAKLFGAGLLSSSTEALASDDTPKLRLSLECLEYDYEISRMQPQLFVADDWSHLNDQLSRVMSHIV